MNNDGSGFIIPEIFNPESDNIEKNLTSFEEILAATDREVNSTLEASSGKWSINEQNKWNELDEQIKTKIGELRNLLEAGRTAAANTQRTDEELASR